jgi:hypothetical protein
MAAALRDQQAEVAGPPGVVIGGGLVKPSEQVALFGDLRRRCACVNCYPTAWALQAVVGPGAGNAAVRFFSL